MGRRDSRWWLATVVAGLVALYAYQQGWTASAEDIALDLLGPLQRGITLGLRPVTQWVEGMQRAGELSAENRQLRILVQSLTSEVVRLREAETENRRLRALLDYQERLPAQRFLTAAVIGRDPSVFSQGLVVDRGARHGVVEDMVVVAEGGLVGRVTHVAENTAKVLLITDPRLAVNAMVQGPDSRATGTVSGLPDQRLLFRLLPQEAPVRPGDIVITSGLGGTFPKGLLIGKVDTVAKSDVELFQEAVVEPAIQPNRLEEVMILRDFVPVSSVGGFDGAGAP